MDDLAGMVQRGFKEIGEQMVTKQELRDLTRAVSDLTTKLSAYMTQSHEEYQHLQGRLTELEERVNALEGRRRRAA